MKCEHCNDWCREEKMGCEGCYYYEGEYLEEFIMEYQELKKHKKLIKCIDTDFFFKIMDCLIAERNGYKSQVMTAYDRGFIHKDKIRAKINYIKSNYSQINGDYFMMNYAIQVLQELLEEGE